MFYLKNPGKLRIYVYINIIKLLIVNNKFTINKAQLINYY